MSRKSHVCATSVPSHACFSPVAPIAVRNCKNIRNRSMRCNSVRSSSSNVDRVSKPEQLVVSSSDSVTNSSKSLQFSPSDSHSVDSSTSSFRVVTHRNIYRKRKLRKSIIPSSFVNSGNNDDISKKFYVDRDKINVLTKAGNYYISSVFFLSVLFWEFLMLGIFINNNSFLKSNRKYIFRDTGFIYNPPFAFRTNYLQTIFSNDFNNPYLFKPGNIFENFVHSFLCRFYYSNLIFDTEYFLENPQFSELPSVFNSVTSIEFPTNHELYFMDFTQLNSTKDTTYFYIRKEFDMFVFWLLGFSITRFLIKIVFTLILELTFITFVFYFILKWYIFINVFIKNLANIVRNVLYILFRILSIFIFCCFVCF